MKTLFRVRPRIDGLVDLIWCVLIGCDKMTGDGEWCNVTWYDVSRMDEGTVGMGRNLFAWANGRSQFIEDSSRM